MSKAIYVPAIMEQLNNNWKSNKTIKCKNGKTHDLKFFTNDSFFKYNVALQCCYHRIVAGCLKHDKSYRERMKIPSKNEFTLIGDSGGFQFASAMRTNTTCDITAEQSLKWQEANADIIMNLDIPSTWGKEVDYEYFKHALKQSLINFEYFKQNKTRTDAVYMNILHGEKIDLMEEWYNAVKHYTENGDFNGWAIGMKPPGDAILQAMGFLFLYEKGEFKDKEKCKWIHFFGTSGKNVVPVISYLANKIDVPVSYDSSSYGVGCRFRTYYMPYQIGPQLSFGENFKRDNPTIKKLPCDCPVCRNIDVKELNENESLSGPLISLHNMYQYIRYNENCNILSDDKEKLLEYMKKIGVSERSIVAIEFIDYAIENGLRQAITHYESYIKTQEVKQCKQKGLWSF